MQDIGEKAEIDDIFPDEHVLDAYHDLIPWFDDFSNYFANNIVSLDLSFHRRKKFMHHVKNFFWDDPYLYRSCADVLICRCMLEVEMLITLEACHSLPVGGHHSGIWTDHKIMQCAYYCPTINQDVHDFAKSSDKCQRYGGILWSK